MSMGYHHGGKGLHKEAGPLFLVPTLPIPPPERVIDREPNGSLQSPTLSVGKQEAYISSSHAIASKAHQPPRLSHKEPPHMSEATDKTLALNVRLKPSEPSAHPCATNYTNVGVAQGIAFVDFGFIEPSLLAAIAKTAKDGQAAPNGLEGALVTRVAMGGVVLLSD